MKKLYSFFVCAFVVTTMSAQHSWLKIKDISSSSSKPNVTLHGFVTYKDKAVFFGNFDKMDTDAGYNCIGQIDPTTFVISKLGTGFTNNDGTHGMVYRAVVFNNEIYVTGQFDKVDGKPSKGIAKWTGTEWQNIDFDLDKRDGFLGVLGSSLYLATNKKLLKLNANTFDIIASNVGTILVFGEHNGRKYVGGSEIKLKDGSQTRCVAELINDELFKVGDFFHNSFGVNASQISQMTSTPYGIVFNGMITTVNGDTLNKALYLFDGTTFQHIGGGAEQSALRIVYSDKGNRLYHFGLSRGAYESNGDYVDGWYTMYWSFDQNRWVPMSRQNQRTSEYVGVAGDIVFGYMAYFKELQYYSQNISADVKGQNKEQVLIFPNPAQGNIYFNFGSSQGNKAIAITDVQGRQVLQTNTNNSSVEINIENLPNGIYTATVSGDNYSTVQKIVVQH